MLQVNNHYHNDNKEGKIALFFGRENCDASTKALNHLIRLGFKVTAVYSKGHGEIFPVDLLDWTGDYIFCFRSMYILPKKLIDKAIIAAINFHPGPPEYPGSGCINYALFENSNFYGVTSHLMTEKVDEGRIVECRRFPIHDADTVGSLLDRTHVKLLDLFYDLVSGVSRFGIHYINDLINKSSGERWSGKKRKIKELDNLSLVSTDIKKNELDKLVRATYTEKYPPKIILHGYEFVLVLDNKVG